VAAWPRLEANAAGTGSSCDGARFTDNGDGTVTDRLTALQWEKKTNGDGSESADPHDADNVYTWTDASTAADGTAFTSFLASLNTGGCFAGQCDWRLPTRDELLTMLSPPLSACPPFSCVHPVLGASAANYWSATTFAYDPHYAWSVYPNLSDSIVLGLSKTASDVGALGVRAGS
jgi:hypothetical protein